ncbi:MAG: transcription antitermination factor NusB [candidate division WOR-3 bacterium]
MKGGRRKARIAAMEIVYRSDLCGNEIEDLLKEVSRRLKITGEDLSYLIRLIEELTKNRKKIDKTIKKNLKDWDFNRLHFLGRAVMRVATCELLFFPDIPPKVAINEAIEIAKEYTDDAGRRFINGVLNGIYQNMSMNKKI